MLQAAILGGAAATSSATGFTETAAAKGEGGGEGGVEGESGEAADDAQAERAADELPKAFRRKAQTKVKEREAAVAGVIWAALAGGFAVVLGATVLLRQDIAEIWPRTATAYAMVGLRVNLVGLVIEDQRAQPMLKDGHADLAVSASLRNVRGRPIAPPPLRISLIAAGGRVVDTQIANPGGAVIPAGEARRFVVNLLDPPASASQVEIAFLPATKRGAPTAPQAMPAARAPVPVQSAADLRGIPAQTAQPLPSGSPYALPAASTQGAPQGPST